MTAVTVENPATPGVLYTPQDGYTLVAVEIIVGNVSNNEPLSVNPLYATLVDADGFTYSAELAGRDGQISVLDLAIGEKARGWVAFVIPDGAVPASIKYETDVLMGNYLQVGLTS